MRALLDRRAPRLSPGGRPSARRNLITAIVGLCVLFGATQLAAANDWELHDIDVREEEGVYRVQARFAIPQPASVAFAVLTDYEQIPRFMPDVRTSTLLERGNGRAVVEQEAVARVMMFSKRVHLVLEIQEEASAIRFRDRCGKSFTRYEGSWQLMEQRGSTAITYELIAKPSFDVPPFLLRRLLKRDARVMIERLQTEMATRSRSSRLNPGGE